MASTWATSPRSGWSKATAVRALSAQAAKVGDRTLHFVDLSGFADAPGIVYFRDPSIEGGEAQYRYEPSTAKPAP